ncbi:MAG TPA: tyrosine-type recombinase/integrase [Pyrinomonadaceae bacterium]|nr:tyrosine-type recombinase/integrase [Pyrinomonadaceae bacterium]
MTRQLRRAQSSLWQWPVNASIYDRHPHLHAHERDEIEKLKYSRIDARQDEQAMTSRDILARLIKPITDVSRHTCDTPTHSVAATRVLLFEMLRRDNSFWIWSAEEWIETIGQDADSFGARHRISTDTRQLIMAAAYLLCGFTEMAAVGRFYRYAFAVRVFGQEAMQTAMKQVEEALHGLGYSSTILKSNLHNLVGEALLINRSPLLDELTYEVLERVRQHNPTPHAARTSVAFSRALHSLGVIGQPLPPAGRSPVKYNHYEPGSRVAPEWVTWCDRWRKTSTSSERTRANVHTMLIKAGRWLAYEHPEIESPAQWTRELAAEFVAAVDRMKVGQYLHRESHHIPEAKKGKPLMSNSKVGVITAVRVLFRDCQEWNWITRRFDPIRAIPIPRKLLAQRKPSPRVIADDVWAKLLWAGLNLTVADLPVCTYRAGEGSRPKNAAWYPLAMVRAIVVTWLFAGLRNDEIRRLRVGCVRWQRQNDNSPHAEDEDVKGTVCLLDVPVNKTGAAFSKPVDRYVGEAIELWEHTRPAQPPRLDAKTGSMEHLLFMYRGKGIGPDYVNNTIIPMLCEKAGVPTADARGNLTSHRARSTIASQLFNAKEPMSLFELQEWLGHRSVSSTQYYARITPTKLAQSYRDAGYFERNRRTIEVLIDQEAIRSGSVADGEPWKYYDLGHGYCTYDFFEQCPHRMACAKCSFYVAKESSRAQLLEAKANLERMMQEIPLQEEERAAVEDGLAAVERLYAKLVDVPTPAGPTPRELKSEVRRELPILLTPVSR